MASRKEELIRTTVLTMAYRREAIAHRIRSPYRQSVYIEARLKGATEEQSKKVANVAGNMRDRVDPRRRRIK